MMKGLRDVVIVAYGRSAVARAGKGSLSHTHPIEYSAQVLRGVLERVPRLEPGLIDDVILGCAKPELTQRYNIGRLVALRAQLPYSVPGQTVNRFCASSLQAVSTGANMIRTGEADVIVAGGVESMTDIPYMGIGNPEFRDAWLDENEPGAYVGMGITAENVAARYGITRKEMEAFAVDSHQKAARARQAGRLAEDIIPVTAAAEDGTLFTFDQDECIRPNSTPEALEKLKPCFREDGVVTAAVSSPTNDGASMVILMAAEKAAELGIRPIARYLGYAVTGVDPNYMGIGPISAVRRVMELTGLTVEQMDVVELNEAFASQSLACIRELKLDMGRVNPNGGAIALGHPLGATGGILVSKALSQLRRSGGTYALVSMCIGGGMGAAAVLEACHEAAGTEGA